MAIRVMYRWRVPAGHGSDFEATWQQGTELIRRDASGALGSLLCRVADEDDVYIGFARWHSRAEWETFIASPIGPSLDAQLLGIEVYEECADLTISD